MSDDRDTTATLYGRRISAADYLLLEETAKDRHEYVAGRAYAMTGATVSHNRLVSNLSALFSSHLSRSSCDVFSNDMKVKIGTLDTYYYPDLIVTCEKLSPKAVHVTAPRLIVEILSPSTMTIDRREKLLAYRAIESLCEYVLVNQEKMQVEIYRKEDAGTWNYIQYKSKDVVELQSLPDGNLRVSIDEIYKRVEFGID